METIIVDIINKLGYFGVTFLIAIENIFPPIPSEVILSFGGFMTTYTKLTIIGLIIASTIGAVIGALILYFIGKLLPPERLEKLVDGKIGHALRFKKEDIYKADTWFDKHGNYTVFFCRFIPIVRSLISIPAGMSGMKFIPFVILTTLGSLIWNTILIVLGSITGENWNLISEFINKYSHLVLILIVVIFIIGIIIYYKKRLKE